MPKIKTTAPWDGKDAEVEIEEEFDLSELDDIDVAEPAGKDEL